MNLPLTGQTGRNRQNGTALIVVIVILALLLVFIMGNIRTLDNLGKELRLLETRQRSRIQMPQIRHAGPATETNAVTAGIPKK